MTLGDFIIFALFFISAMITLDTIRQRITDSHHVKTETDEGWLAKQPKVKLTITTDSGKTYSRVVEASGVMFRRTAREVAENTIMRAYWLEFDGEYISKKAIVSFKIEEV